MNSSDSQIGCLKRTPTMRVWKALDVRFASMYSLQLNYPGHGCCCRVSVRNTMHCFLPAKRSVYAVRNGWCATVNSCKHICWLCRPANYPLSTGFNTFGSRTKYCNENTQFEMYTVVFRAFPSPSAYYVFEMHTQKTCVENNCIRESDKRLQEAWYPAVWQIMFIVPIWYMSNKGNINNVDLWHTARPFKMWMFSGACRPCPSSDLVSPEQFCLWFCTIFT